LIGFGAFVISLSASIVSGAVVVAATQSDAAVGLDIWTLIEKGGAPMAGVLLLALFEVTRRHDKAYKIIEARDATILELSKRQISTTDTANEIGKDAMTIARDQMEMTRALHNRFGELITLLRGKLDIG
jgi:hypothetical protein